MQNIGKDDDRYWHRLTDALHILSVHLNLPLRLLRSDACERMEALWRRNQKTESNGHPPVPLDELLALVKAPIPNDPLGETVDPNLLYWLCPLPPAPGPEPEPRIKRLDETIYQAIYRATPRFSNPFHAQIKDCFPTLRARARLDYLRRLRELQEGAEDPTIVYSPAGMAQMLLGLDQKGVLLAGPIWLESQSSVRLIPLSAKQESKIAEMLENLKKLKELENINSETARRCPIKFEQRAHLLQLAAAYPISSQSDLTAKGKAAQASFSHLLELIEPAQTIEGGPLHTVEWSELSRFVLFWHLDPAASIAKREIRDALPSNRQAVMVNITRPLSTRQDRTQVAQMRFNIGNSSEEQKNYLGELVFDVEREPKPTEVPTRLLWVNPDPLMPASSEGWSDKLSDDLSRWYRSFLAEGYASDSHLTRIFLARLDYILQHQPFSDISVRLKYMVKQARLLVGGDVADYLHYNGLEDRLEPDALDRRTAFMPQDGTDHRWNEEVTKALTDLFVRLADKNSHEERAKSSAYRALDKRMLVSRLTEHKDADLHAPFRGPAHDAVRTVSVNHPQFPEERDILAVPVMYHGRIQGVLHLSSATPFRFVQEDRLRILQFVHILQTELFEARILQAQQEMHTSLNRTLEGQLTEQGLFDHLATGVAQLLGARGTSLWWQSEHRGNAHLELVGCAGRPRDVLDPGAWAAVDDPLFESLIDVRREKQVDVVRDLSRKGSFGKQLTKVGLFECMGTVISDRMGRLAGVILVHDTKAVLQAGPLGEDMRFLAREIGHIVAHYRTYSTNVRSVQSLVAHDIGAALRELDGSRRGIRHFCHHIPQNERQGFDAGLRDIERNVILGHDLVDYLTNQKIQREIDFNQADPLLGFIHHLKLREPLKAPLSLNQLMKSLLHSLLPQFRKKEMVFRQDHLIERVWVHEDLVRRVLSNIFDNIVKYGVPKSAVEIGSRSTPGEFQLVTISCGAPLRGRSAKDPEWLFREGERGGDPQIQQQIPGHGLGLFIARKIAAAWGGDVRLNYTPSGDWGRYQILIVFPPWLLRPENPW